jgi:hypothetical protein
MSLTGTKKLPGSCEVAHYAVRIAPAYLQDRRPSVYTVTQKRTKPREAGVQHPDKTAGGRQGAEKSLQDVVTHTQPSRLPVLVGAGSLLDAGYGSKVVPASHVAQASRLQSPSQPRAHPTLNLVRTSR